MRSDYKALLLTLAIPVAQLEAQMVTDLRSGDLVRLELPAATGSDTLRFKGTVVALNGPSLVFRPKGADADHTVAISDLTRLDVASGRAVGRSVLRGAGIGVLAGAALGAGWMYWVPNEEGLRRHQFSDSVYILIGMFWGSSAGAVIGGILGGTVAPLTRWVRVASP